MTEEEKRLQQGQNGQPVYGGAYDREINNLYQKMSERPGFRYEVDGDALFQNYKNQYVQNAKRSMKDTMGKASTLTGGFGSSYAQGVGQQAYDENMRSLTDVIPELEGRAYARWQDEGDRLMQRYNMAHQLGAADQATRQYDQAYADQRGDVQYNRDFQERQYADQRSDAQRNWDFAQQQYADQRGDVQYNRDFQERQYGDSQTQQGYGNLTSAILTSGYMPSDEELAAANMTREQANALQQAWIGSNPELAYMAGALSADDYFKLTGRMPPSMPAQGGVVYVGGNEKKTLGSKIGEEKGSKGSGSAGGSSKGSSSKGASSSKEGATTSSQTQNESAMAEEYLRYLEENGVSKGSQIYQSFARAHGFTK